MIYERNKQFIYDSPSCQLVFKWIFFVELLLVGPIQVCFQFKGIVEELSHKNNNKENDFFRKSSSRLKHIARQSSN
jgi:hypothetical protein